MSNNKDCKHRWMFKGIKQDVFLIKRSQAIALQRCLVCRMSKNRKASVEEFDAEIKRLTCQACGFKLSLHEGYEGDYSPGFLCIKLMGKMIVSLQEKLATLEKWQYETECFKPPPRPNEF